MKTKIIIFISFVLLCSSCLNDFLNVEPQSDISTANFWQTPEDVRAALNSVYSDLQTNYNKNSGGNYIAWFEARSDNFIGAPTSTDNMPMKIVNTNNLNSSHPSSDWNVWYKSISSINYTLHFVPGIKKITQSEKNNFLAEAYFLRAYCYFNLACIWGDVPLVLEPSLNLNEISKPTQSTQSLVLERVGLDLEKSVELVNTNSLAKDVFRFNSGALYCLYSHYAMWIHDYTMAEKYTNLVLTLGYSLVDKGDFATVCSKATTSENIWTLKWLYENNGKNNAIFKMNGMNSPQLIPSLRFRDLWANTDYTTDTRRAQTLNTAIVYSSTHVTAFPKGAAIWKWEPGIGVEETNEKYFPIFRLGEIILLRAEALNKLDRKQEALDLLNQIRTRANLTGINLVDYGTLTGDDLTLAIEDDILQERQLELIGEGYRWFDLVRTGRAMSVMNDFFDNYLKVYDPTYKFTYFTEEWQLYFPVFYDNILENENLHQTGKY